MVILVVRKWVSMEEEKGKKKHRILSKILRSTPVRYAICILILILILLIVIKVNSTPHKSEFAYINQVLEKSSELTTVKLKIRGIEEYIDEGTFILNKADFTMVYRATVSAGVDLKEVKVSGSNFKKEVIVEIPPARVFDAHVEPDEISFYDEQFAFFNTDSKMDITRAIKEAEVDAIEEAKETGILKFADIEAEAVIKNLITSAIPDGYKIVIKKLEK